MNCCFLSIDINIELLKLDFMMIEPNMNHQWRALLNDAFKQKSFIELEKFLADERDNYTIYPPEDLVFKAFELTSVDDLKVVILGQDPYHGLGQAHGLSFSVPKGIKIPPSLVNIYKEIYLDLNLPIPAHGNLEKWAKQGVLLLNATLTVRANVAGSHQKKGWEVFTDSVIETISANCRGVVFLLWGNYALAKERLIDDSKHLILRSVHPSPLSAHRGFIGCGHFSATNSFLSSLGKTPIDWSV